MLKVSSLKREIGERTILININFNLDAGETLFVRGPCGAGKTLLLRSIACLDPIQGGEISLDSETPVQTGIPSWRSRVTYLQQLRLRPKGTPSETYYTVQSFSAQRGRARGDLPALIHLLALEQTILNRSWNNLSVGEVQKVYIAICLALKPKVLLLDDPTGCLDIDSSLLVERILKESGISLIWVTSDNAQPGRVGGRILNLPLGTEMIV